MSIEENINLDKKFIVSWDAHDVNAALALLSNDVMWSDIGSPEPLKGKEAVRHYMQSWFTAFPDMKTTIKNRVVTEDQVAAEMEFSGTNTGPLQMGLDAPSIPATGKKIRGKGTYFVRIRNGKAVEVHTYPDAAGMMMQLGLAPSSK